MVDPMQRQRVLTAFGNRLVTRSIDSTTRTSPISYTWRLELKAVWQFIKVERTKRASASKREGVMAQTGAVELAQDKRFEGFGREAAAARPSRSQREPARIEVRARN